MRKENTEQYSARRRNLGEKEKEIALKNFISYLETHDFNTERKDCEKSMKESRASNRFGMKIILKSRGQ